MTYQLEPVTADRLTSWANGAADPAMEAPVIKGNLGALMAGFDAPLPPPQKIDFAGIERQAIDDMNNRFADLPQGRSYWTQEAVVTPQVTPSLSNQSTEPAVYYGSTPSQSVAPVAEIGISMASLNRAANYASSVGNSFNKGAAQPILAHMASRFAQTNKPQI
jgi:hypothetical protein